MKNLLDTSVLTYEVQITDEDLKKRMAFEVMEKLGLLDNGAPIKGVTWKVLRDQRRGGGYAVRVTRDVKQSDQPRLEGPKG
jgi:hypothetical protein